MQKDALWKEFFSDNERYADIINALGCGGEQIVTKDDLTQLDTQTGFLRERRFFQRIFKNRVKFRDMIRKTAFGMNFAVIGLEHQEEIDYALPLRNMNYDAGEYERQAAIIRRRLRKNPAGLKRNEYLYGFSKDSRLHPAVTFVLYYGSDEWDGAKTLHELLDFSELPERLKKLTPDYHMNLIEIRKFKHTELFKTDVKQVFDFIRCAEDKHALKTLVESDAYYQNMEEDAFDIVSNYIGATELIETKDYYKEVGGEIKMNMCKALRELIADGREEGMEQGMKQGIEQGIKALVNTCISFNATQEATLEKLMEQFQLTREVATEKIRKYWK